MRLAISTLCAALVGFSLAAGAEPPLPNPFYAMDTCTKRPYPRNDITPAEQFDLLKELGYKGIAWTEESPGAVRAAVKDAEDRGLKMFTIYCSATVTGEGELKPSPLIVPIMETLRGHDTVIWLHLGGKGPRIDTLSAATPVITQLRQLAAEAERNGLKIAIYPHIGDWTEKFHDALRVARLVDRGNFGVTFNLCHALATGDEARIPALIQDAGPLIFQVTINGADAGIVGPRWDHLIQNLDRGSYDVGSVLRSLQKAGYTGPIGLQGYGLTGDRRENLARSMDGWKKLSAGD